MPAAAALATCIALFAVTFDYTEHYLAVSDGTPAGTDTILKTRRSPYYFTQAGESVVFVGKDPDHGSDLWVTDGTGAGTALLKDINGTPRKSSDPGHQLFFEYSFATSDSLVVFPAEDSSRGREIWVTDGTSAGTRLLKEFAPGSEDGIDKDEIYGADYIASNGGKTFFIAHDGDGGSTLWSTDGTKESTQRAVPKKIRGRDITEYGAMGDLLFFVNDGRELWKTAGTAKSAGMLKKFNSHDDIGVGHASRHGFVVFTVEDRKLGAEPWVTDGTPEGTMLLKDIEPGSGDSFPGPLFDGADFSLFLASTSKFGREPWVTRGDTASTRLLMDIIPGETDSEIYGYARLKNKVVFSAWVREGHSSRVRLFITDGTPKGTRQLSSRAQPTTGTLVSLGDRVLYQDYRSNQAGTDEIWATFGEPDDEVQVSHFGEVNPDFRIDSMAAVEVLRDAKRATPCPD